MNWFDTIASDIRFGVRLLAKERWFTLSAIVALALGIGVTTMMVTIINGYYFRGLPVDDPDRILSVGTLDFSGRRRGVSYLEYRQWRGALRSFADVAAFSRAPMTLGELGQSPDSLPGAYVSAGAFEIAGARPWLGRAFQPDDDRVGAAAVVMLAHRLWVMRYQSDPAVIGRSVVVNRVPATVIGVMPEGFEFPFREAVWQPLALMPPADSARRDARTLTMFGRLALGVTPTEARAELAALAAAAARDHPDTNTGVRTTVAGFAEQQIGGFSTAFGPMVMAVMALVVLFIGCANVANLLLARAVGRSREMAIRASVGATRSRLVRQLLVESLILAGLAGALGLWLSQYGVRFLSDAFGRNVPYWMQLSIDARVVLILVATCGLTAVLFGLAPAMFVSRTDVGGVMREGGRIGVTPRARRWTHVFLVAELALTVILLAGAGLLVRSYLVVYRADRVVDASRVLTLQLSLPDGRYTTPSARTDFYQRLEERLRTLDGAFAATIASARPFAGSPSRTLSFDGRSAGDDGEKPSVATVAIGTRYFEVLQLRLLGGRAFTERDGTGGEHVAIVNQQFAERYFAQENPLGRRIRLSEPNADRQVAPWLTIVGVAPDVRQAIAAGPRPVVYVPIRSHAQPSVALIVGGLAEPAGAMPRLRKEVATLDPDVTLFNVRPLSELLDDSRMQPRLFGTGMGVFAAIAVLLSAIGLYAVTSYGVLQRTHEIGVRMALGAPSCQVVWLVVRRAMVPLSIGLAIGLIGAFGVGRLVRGLLIQTSSTDPMTLGGVVAVLVTVALAACLVPARRASRLDPLAVLRHE